MNEKAIYKSNNKTEANKTFEEWLLLWCVDPDNVQMTVIYTLLVFVGVTRASLCASLGPWWVTGRARLRFTLRGNACKVVHPARQMRTQRGCFQLPPLVHIFAWWGTWTGRRHCVFSHPGNHFKGVMKIQFADWGFNWLPCLWQSFNRLEINYGRQLWLCINWI